MTKQNKGLVQERRWGQERTWGQGSRLCSPWQWLELVLFPGWPARAAAALGLGVPQLTVKPFSDSERKGLSLV